MSILSTKLSALRRGLAAATILSLATMSLATAATPTIAEKQIQRVESGGTWLLYIYTDGSVKRVFEPARFAKTKRYNFIGRRTCRLCSPDNK